MTERMPLSPKLRARLGAAAVRIGYSDGELIHGRGDAKPGLSIIRAGAVRFTNSGADGSLVSTGSLGPGQFFGEATLFAGRPRTHDAVAMGDTIVDQISSKRFFAIFDEEPELARIMVRAITQRLYQALDFMDDLRRLPLKVRAAKIIASRIEVADGECSVVANQSDLAYVLGVSRVSIGKVLSALQKDKLIKLGYGRIDVSDPRKLRAWVDRNAKL